MGPPRVSGYRGLNYADPYGLCPTGPEPCSTIGNFFAGVHAGIQQLSNTPAAVDAESGAFKAGRTLGSLLYDFSHPYHQRDALLAASAGMNNIPVGPGSVKIGKDFYQVHAEVGGSGKGQVHVQVIRGPNKGDKFTDPASMPRAVRDNAEIQRRIQKAQELVEKLTEGQQ